jgi:hypothetical protein
MCWDWSTWTNPSGDLCNGMIGFLYICLLHPICSLTLYMSSNYHFPFCSIFAVPAKYCSHAEVYLWPICCIVHYPHSVALCIPSHCWRSIQECTTKDSISLPHWPFWINWWRTLVLFAVLKIQLFICHHHCCQNIWLVWLFHKWNDRIRVPYPFQWGAPTFDAGEAFAMMAASFVALVEVWLTTLRQKRNIPAHCCYMCVCMVI